MDTTEEPIYMATRYGVGGTFATVAALYNLFLIRQRIIKNSIFLTKSNNPKVVKAMCLVVGSLYYAGLYSLWHIPSFFSEIGVRAYVASEDAVSNILLRDHLEQILLNNPRLKKSLEKDGLRL